MARLFIKHQPIDTPVLSIDTLVIAGGKIGFQVPRLHVKGVECKYICFVHKGRCFAAKAMDRSKSGGSITFYCVPLEDQPCVQEMILADMILN